MWHIFFRKDKVDMDINNKIKEIMVDIINDERITKGIGSDTQLIEEGLLDSIVIIQLIVEIEKRFGIKEIGVEDIVPENFNTIDCIVSLVEKYVEKKEKD